jgi:hypothetical protein
MRTTPHAKPGRDERAFKSAVTGLERRKLTVAGYRFGTQPLVDLRILAHQGEGETIALTLPQARQAIRLLLDAIEAADELARHDGTPLPPTGREPAAVDDRHVGAKV